MTADSIEYVPGGKGANQAVAAASAVMKARPRFVMKLPAEKRAHMVRRALARVAQSVGPKDVEREYHALFIGIGRGELLPYASFYMTGFLNEKPLAQASS